jgi:intracellular sulfur oxidation DsrE/DsrF family protein
MTFLASESPVRDNEERKIVLHVNFADPEALNFVLNNVENIRDHYRDRGNGVEIRVVCHGPGLHMLRDDTSPVKERLVGMAASIDELSFYACSNTMERMAKAEGKQPQLVAPVTMVPAGLPEVIELQRSGWIYLKP